MHELLITPYNATDVPESGGTNVRQSISHSFWRNASIMSVFGMRAFRWQFGSNCANVQDGLPSLDVATSRVDVQTAVGLLTGA